MDEDEAGSGTSFDQRLKAARTRQGLDEAPISPDQARPDNTATAVFLRVGVELVSSLLVGLAVGWGLDHFLKTRPVFLILFVFLGGVAGMINVWRLVASDAGRTNRGGMP